MSHTGWNQHVDDPARVKWASDIYKTFADRHPQSVSYVDLHAYVCAGGAASPRLDGTNLTSDGIHLDPAGSRKVWTWLTPRLAALASVTPSPPSG